MIERARWKAFRASSVVLLALLCATLRGANGFAADRPEMMSAFRDQITSAQRLAAACAANAAACDETQAPPDARVSRGTGMPDFNADWEWLRDALTSAKKLPPEKRAKQMQAAGAHLAELAVDSRAGATPALDQASFRGVRTKANSILARDEFRAAEGPSWLDRQIARLEDWIGRAFMGMQNIGAHNPWLAPLVEWLCFGLAAGGLVFFVRRSLARQSLRIALGEAAAGARRNDRDARDWARLADERAAAGDWRDAIHCLYWAAIVSLEARNAWRANPTRTPREYLRLLRPGSDAQGLLRTLTALFERAWYGQGEAREADFRAAQASFAALRSAPLKASVDRGDVAGRTAATGAA